nr:H140 [uncultured bacterium]
MSEGASNLDPATAVTVGRVLSPHGVRGDVKVLPLSDFPERFKPGAEVWLQGVPVRIERSRWQGRVVVVKLEGIDDRDAVEAIRDQELMVPEIAPLNEEGVFYQHDIIGLTVRDLEGQELGEVTDIFSTGSNDVYVIEGEKGQLLLPALADVVHDIDLKAKLMTVELMEGLEFQGKGRRPPRIKA